MEGVRGREGDLAPIGLRRIDASVHREFQFQNVIVSVSVS